MKIAIMQPYFFPYIGYFQLMNFVDEFVIYDNIEFTKKGWINRNRILVNNTDSFITISIKNDSDYLDVRQRILSDAWPTDSKKMLNRIEGAYKKAPFFSEVFVLISESLKFEDRNLFRFILNSIENVRNYLNIRTPMIVSSTLPIDDSLKAEYKVIEICKILEATTYVNPIGGLELYNKENFIRQGIKLEFLKANNINYNQFEGEFVPWLSIIDVLMFNSRERVINWLGDFQLIK